MRAILATITFETDVPHPKVRGVVDGYQPHHRFEWADFLTTGIHRYGDECRHYPGETLKMRIEFPFWSYFGSNVSVGDCFEISEASRVIGHGVVDEVLGPTDADAV
ncbi:MAG: hypothetical protein LBG99_03340 [Propionibacteriaceae bacterium]|nr:hypothetical protein [Propionibacteriaceae bacterium]